ncbi:uncharacterized protein LOC112565178 isoform X3 [Pomacea canaliculata]|uniref:uncharacterized protein LOC112565178 isoform X3 n=1 Tax=Pomacea canaliculata TaxID=400727 RepID=UPI000D72E2F8|nr:uncharacterized protein LOC112565178 isoform X3 [Pomacea canaliculata]
MAMKAVIFTFLLQAALSAAHGRVSAPHGRVSAPHVSDRSCNAIGGICQNDHNYCRGSYENGLCSGSANRRCCVPGSDRPCTAIGGICQYDNVYCWGSYKNGLCSGLANRRCCVSGSDHDCSVIGGICQMTATTVEGPTRTVCVLGQQTDVAAYIIEYKMAASMLACPLAVTPGEARSCHCKVLSRVCTPFIAFYQ